MTTIKFYKKTVRWYYQWNGNEYWIDLPEFFNKLVYLLDKDKNEITFTFGEFNGSSRFFIWTDGQCIHYSDELCTLGRILNAALPSYAIPRNIRGRYGMMVWSPYQIINLE